MAPGAAAPRVPAPAHDKGAEVGEHPLRPDRLSKHILLRGPKERPASYDDIDPEIKAMYEKLGIAFQERAALAGVAVDAVPLGS